jgi:hypothetical protein
VVRGVRELFSTMTMNPQSLHLEVVAVVTRTTLMLCKPEDEGKPESGLESR